MSNPYSYNWNRNFNFSSLPYENNGTTLPNWCQKWDGIVILIRQTDEFNASQSPWVRISGDSYLELVLKEKVMSQWLATEKPNTSTKVYDRCIIGCPMKSKRTSEAPLMWGTGKTLWATSVEKGRQRTGSLLNRFTHENIGHEISAWVILIWIAWMTFHDSVTVVGQKRTSCTSLSQLLLIESNQKVQRCYRRVWYVTV